MNKGGRAEDGGEEKKLKCEFRKKGVAPVNGGGDHTASSRSDTDGY